MSIDVSTIGFTQTTAEKFFDRLLKQNVRTLIDVRLNNTSQLSAFAKADDLAYFCKVIGKIQYIHKPDLAPTDDILKAYKRDKGDWRIYEHLFLKLMEQRAVEYKFRPEQFDGCCLLCSEAQPHHCHRRLVCDYLNAKWGSVLKVKHL